MHFDMDENRLRQGRKAYHRRHPVGEDAACIAVDNERHGLAFTDARAFCAAHKRPSTNVWQRAAYWHCLQVCSSILYLGNAGGPTLILNQTPEDSGLAADGWLAAPAAGRLAVFAGNLLHGVVPGVSSSWSLKR